MNNRFSSTLNTFGLGICVEYIFRVEASIWPIIVATCLFLLIVLDYINAYLDEKKLFLLNKKIEVGIKYLENESEASTIPNGWMVDEAGQDPVSMLWYVNLINFTDIDNNYIKTPRSSHSVGYDSYYGALKNAISGIKVCVTEN